MQYSILRTCACSLGALLMLVMLTAPLTPSAHADGGAPQLAYVTGTDQGISVIDIAQRHISSTIALAGQPPMALLHPDGHALYVAESEQGQVAVLATKTGKQICAAKLPGHPAQLALSLDASTLYAAGSQDTHVYAIDPANCSIRHIFETHQPIYGLAVAASTADNATPSTPNQLWITGASALTVFEVTGHLLGTIPVAAGPQHISIPAGFTAYVTTRQGSVIAIDLNTRRIFRTLLTAGAFGPMDYDATTGEIYVPDQQHHALDILAPVTLSSSASPQEPTRLLHLDAAPQSIAITNDGQLGFVALADGTVLMLDIPGRSTITSITVGGTPQFIITGLYPPANNLATRQSPPPPPPQQATSLVILRTIIFVIAACTLLACAIWFLWKRDQQRRASRD